MIARALYVVVVLGIPLILTFYRLSVVKYEIKWPLQRHVRLQIYCVVWFVSRY